MPLLVHSRQQFKDSLIGPARPVFRRTPFIRLQTPAKVIHPPGIRPPKGLATTLNQAKLVDFMHIAKMKLQKVRL
uniref:Uncharacterized protein n=1 Tax=Globodera rostochiensis TaxID=31243 RepID=A0A914HV32_GLORO